MNKYPARFAEKKRDIQIIHIAKQQLAMDDDTYRAMLWAVARVKSSTELDFVGRRNVLDHLEACGFKRTKPHPRKLADDPQSKKIRALWLELHAAGKVRNPSESALAAFVKRQTGRDALQWLNKQEASSVIEELKKWLAREVQNVAK
ncbi:MAG: regulatory protein GemA [Nitrosomonadales bacterium]|nr:regulatory protein GemA [Nitrosomonadales bacterium]